MLSILYNIIIAPIELIVEIIFELIFRLLGQRETNQGLAVIGVSIVISLLTLPLYHRADSVQQKERDIQKNLSKWITHIKKTFKGDERFMMLQAYYRENNYSPLQSLNGSLSLMLEIPFFIAAYHFLSNLTALQGAGFLHINNLGAPDNLIKIGSLSINLLPLLMTLINCTASAIYLKGFPLKDKIQTYGMALIFLVLLYKSPSGLVLYWTCNNIFSLIKNIFYKIKNPKKTASMLCAIAGTLFTCVLFSTGILNSLKKYVAVIILLLCSYIPLLLYLLKKKNHNFIFSKQSEQNYKKISLFIFSAISLTILMGIMIPSAVISSSPAEFVNIQNYRTPLLYLVNSTSYALGFFLLWAGIIRYILPHKIRHTFDFLFFTLSLICLINYLFFGKNLGTISSILVFDNEISFSSYSKLINLLSLILIIVLSFFVFRFSKIKVYVILIIIISTSFLSISQIYKTQKILNNMSYIKNIQENNSNEKILPLSTKGKNVIVFMLDRAISGYLPYIFEEKPEIKKQFEGFTYYPNTLSYGIGTQIGTPPLFGGYEYTPEEINKRFDEYLSDKQNEALKVMPVLFGENHWNVTVCDPPYAGYKWIPDLSIYDDCPNTKAYHLSGKIKNDLLLYNDNDLIAINNRNFFCYSIFKSLPLFISVLIYDDGNYLSAQNLKRDSNFIKEYSVLSMLNNITTISNTDLNSFIAIANCTTHEPYILQLPDYEIKEKINNTDYKTAADGFIDMSNDKQISHYHVNMVSLMAIGKWLDFMRENNVYDNTRIIIVADHGSELGQFDYMLINNPKLDVESCNPLLLVKDFNSKDFSTSNEFMTHADVPSLATKDVIDNPTNPFTGKKINSEEKTAHPQKMLYYSKAFDVNTCTRKTFEIEHLYSIHDNIFNEKNWELLE